MALHEWDPIGTVFWHQSSADEQDNVDNPPNADTTESEQFSYCSSSVTQTESVNAQETKENAVE